MDINLYWVILLPDISVYFDKWLTTTIRATTTNLHEKNVVGIIKVRIMIQVHPLFQNRTRFLHLRRHHVKIH